MEAIIQAINDGHVYAYITKPWEPEQLKQVMKQAVEHYELTVENERLLADLQRANLFLAAVMDELDTGAIAVDANDVVQAVNRPVREYLGLDEDPCGTRFDDLLANRDLAAIKSAAVAMDDAKEVAFYDVDTEVNRFRVTNRALTGADGKSFGRVILFREVSHEPLQRRFNEILGELVSAQAEVRPQLERARDQLPTLADEVRASEIRSAGMNELADRISRTRTAVEHWLEVDDAMGAPGFPDAQVLQDRMRIAMNRWPLRDEVPERVLELARRVEDYYESGEKSDQRAL
jgi:PAS domain-containing protein